MAHTLYWCTYRDKYCKCVLAAHHMCAMHTFLFTVELIGGCNIIAIARVGGELIVGQVAVFVYI